MKITTAAEMREIDRVTSERFGVPSLTLMENAGSAIADFILRNHPDANRVTVVCGKGNNGGDGFVVARKLHRAGRVVEVMLLTSRTELKGDALTMFERLPLRPVEVTNAARVGRRIRAQPRQLRSHCRCYPRHRLSASGHGPVADAIAIMNRSGKPVVAVDIPSGADSDSMTPQSGDGIAHADAIITFTAPRPAHVFGNLTRGPIVVAAHRFASGSNRVGLEPRGDDPARFCRAARASSARQQQRFLRSRPDCGRLVRQVGSSGHGRNGCATGWCRTEHRRYSGARAHQCRRLCCRADDRTSARNRGRFDQHGRSPERTLLRP